MRERAAGPFVEVSLNGHKLRFHEQAWAEWQRLDGSVREPLKKKLAERLEQPRVPSEPSSRLDVRY